MDQDKKTSNRIEAAARAYERIRGPIVGHPETLDQKSKAAALRIRKVVIPAILFAADNPETERVY